MGDDDRLLLEGARDLDALEALAQLAEELLGGGGHTAHSPSPRTTWKGTFLDQSMNVFMFSRLNSIGMASSRTSASKRSAPTRVANWLNVSSAEERSLSYMRSHRSTASGTRLAARRDFRRVP